MVKVYAIYRKKGAGLTIIKDEVPVEILKRCQTESQVKDMYLIQEKLSWMEITDWCLEYGED